MKFPAIFAVAATTFMALGTLRGAELDRQEVSALTPGELEIRKYLPAEEFDLATVRLWPVQPPDEPHRIKDESVVQIRRGMQIQSVSQPSITIARPLKSSGPVPVIVVCPGGGYGGVGINEGGVDIINWLKSRGIAGVFLKYRVPKRNQGYEMYHHALQDIQRAISLLRSHAAELRIKPDQIGVIGFSAGGNLAAMLSLYHREEDRLYKPMDEADHSSCRPDFVAMVAPAYLTNPIVSDKLVPGLKPDKIARNVTPPIFITSAITDKFTVGASHFFLLLREKHVMAELHVYERGGHAEGIHEGQDNQWPPMFEDWLRRRGILNKATPKP